MSKPAKYYKVEDRGCEEEIAFEHWESPSSEVMCCKSSFKGLDGNSYSLLSTYTGSGDAEVA